MLVDPPVVEVHSHGGAAAVAMVRDALVALGAHVESPERSIEANARTPLAAQAECDLAQTSTLRAAEVLLDQVDGALDAELGALASLIDSLPGNACARLDGLLAQATVGCRLVRGWRVALAGRPNVGKSRLLNALAGYERAIVDSTPGTTRDVLTVRTALDGWPVELCDTAGVRVAADGVEAAGIASARITHAEADLVVLVLDRSEPLTPADEELMAAHSAALWVASKADLPASWPLPERDITVVAAEKGDGVTGLAAGIAHRLVPHPPAPGTAVPFRAEQVGLLEACRQALRIGDAGQAHACVAALIRRSSKA